MKPEVLWDSITEVKVQAIGVHYIRSITEGPSHQSTFLVLRSYRTAFVIAGQSLSRVFATPWTAEGQASLSFTISRSSPKLMSIELVVPSNHRILCCPLLPLPSIFPSISVFSNELALRPRWPKYRSFSISPSNEYSGLISFRMDWFGLLAVQGTLKNHRMTLACG